MIDLDFEETRHLVVIADGVGIRTVMKMEHEDGIELLRQLTEFYGRIEFGKDVNPTEAPTKRGLWARIFRKDKKA